MSNNLIVSYDLHSLGQNYHDVIEAIKSLGSWAKVQQSVWYVSSHLTAEQALQKVKTNMDSNDSLIVVNATSNNASWHNLSDEVASHIRRNWN